MKRSNRYDYAIILLLASLSLGIIGGAYQLVRLLAILFVPLALSSLSMSLPRTSSLEKFGMLFVFCFCGYAWISLLWTSDLLVGLKEAVYFPIHTALFLELILFSKCANSPRDSLFKGWILAVFLTLPIASVELFMDKHLPMSLLQEGHMQNYGAGYGIQNVRFASVTFGNYNTYNLFLVLGSCVIATALLCCKKRLVQYFFLTALGISGCIILLNASRGGVISMGVIGSLFLIALLRYPVFGKKLLLFGGGLVGGIGLAYFSADLFLRLSSRLDSGGLFSDEGRVFLIIEGIKICCDTLGLGTGIGSMISVYFNRVGSGILATHNVLIELLVQYGVVIGAFFVFFVAKLFFAARKQRDFALRYLVFSGVLSLPIWGVINSVYWTLPALWAFMATLCVATSLMQNVNYPLLRKFTIAIRD